MFCQFMFFIEVNCVVVFCFLEFDVLVWGFFLYYLNLEIVVEILVICFKS